METQDLAVAIVIARDTGASLTDWESQFCETLSEKLDGDNFWLSPAQTKSLIRLAEKLGFIYD